MADPVTWMTILSAVGTTTAVVGAVKQGQAASAAESYNAKVNEQNAAAAEQQGAAAFEAQQRDAQRRIGAMTADYGASGASLTDSSASDVLRDSIRMATLDGLTTKYNYKLKGLGYVNEATLNKANAKNAKTSSYFDATSTALRGGLQIASYYR